MDMNHLEFDERKDTLCKWMSEFGLHDDDMTVQMMVPVIIDGKKEKTDVE